MRRFIPELEIQIQKTRCDYLKFEEESIPCLIVDFTLSKYPLTEYTIHSIEVTLKRSEESYAFDCFYTSKPLKNIRLTSKKSDTQSAIIKASDLPFQGFQPDDKLFFSIEYSNDSDEKPKKRSVTFIHRDSEWEIYGNTCDKIQNSHYTSFVLPVFEKNNVTVTLTGIAYDFEKTSYYFSIANYSEIPIKLYSIEYYISVIRNGQIRTYDNCNDIPISEVDAHSTKVGIMEIGNRPTEEFDYDLMTELDNDTKIKATASIGLSVEFNDGDDHEFSDWIVSELSTKPSMPILDEEPFEYSEHIKVKPSTVLSYADFIVFSYAFNCLNNHDTEMVNAVISIATPSGRIVEKTVTAAYCATCDKYIILNSDYEMLKSLGVLLCKQISFDKFVEAGADSGYRNWKDKSDLRLLGYTVNAGDNLSDQQRHIILTSAVDCGLYTVESIKSFLGWLVEQNANKPQNRFAVEKWQQDMEYISNYSADRNRTVGIRSLIKTNYRKK